MFLQTKLGTLLATAIAIGLGASAASADPPDTLRNFRLIPRHSTLDVTGGIAGIDQTYNLLGRFGLVTGYRDGVSCAAIGCPPPPSLVPFAQFVDVDVKTVIPNDPRALAPQFYLDQFVDLESLNGTFRDPSLLVFRGQDEQHAPFKLQAIIRGRLIHLIGTNEAPCCDFFNYKIDAYAHIAPFADFNFDGTVDSADYTAWRDHLGMASGAELDQGDADGDGDVDQDDYAILRQDFGTAIDMAALADTEALSLSAVPEPATISLLMLGLLAAAPLVRRVVRRVR
jgi:Dockerin type I domain/PEP-CTERM motif